MFFESLNYFDSIPPKPKILPSKYKMKYQEKNIWCQSLDLTNHCRQHNLLLYFLLN